MEWVLNVEHDGCCFYCCFILLKLGDLIKCVFDYSYFILSAYIYDNE